MEHIGLVEAVVTQFVHQDFVGGEVEHAFGKPLLQGIYQQEQARLAQLARVHAVLGIAIRTEGEDHLAMRMRCVQLCQPRAPLLHHLRERENLLAEMRCGLLVAVSHNHALVRSQPIYMVRAQGHEEVGHPLGHGACRLDALLHLLPAFIARWGRYIGRKQAVVPQSIAPFKA